MKKIAFWNNYTEFSHNRLFDESQYAIGEDLGYPILFLKKELEKKGYIVETLDMDNPETYEKILFLDYPDQTKCCCDIQKIPIEKKYLIVTECEMIYKANADVSLFNQFHKVFTYNDFYVKKYGYIKLSIPNKMKIPLQKQFSQKKFCTLMAGNKTSTEPGELYSKRLEAINYFESHHSSDFEFFGIGWNTYTFHGPKIIRALNRFPFAKHLFAKKHRCYKGRVSQKLSTLSNYKYCICYENTDAIPGYISEKIWDCLFAGTIPIYLGAPNISDYIPEDAFIDRRKFASDEALYQFISSLTKEQYDEYLSHAAAFIASANAFPFSSEGYAQTIITNLDLIP